ncbi:hypothetical protein [Sphingomonas sp. TX0522]|uniref:hypothetical protein n=1 Tax=Sphingomonas sp. TX0522 TaxID=2479205 RepID=UPI0018DF49D1|nr:hypothetical protein [Sphingomonas sp. TX0522]MBI0533027.1 hypothetical protein [Sphingomonas sp. TX0522]
MSRASTRRDERYSIAREFCGQPKARQVARFCGDWLGHAPNRRGARAIIEAHQDARALTLRQGG